MPAEVPGYRVPAGRSRAELSVRRSRFVATLDRAGGKVRARAVVEGVQHEFPDATHHCWAFQSGPPGDTREIGSSDAGEPHGTAGRPILEALLHSDVGEVVAVVSRWYGGVKLGKGGLARAYSEAVVAALSTLETAVRAELHSLVVDVEYADVDALLRAVVEYSGRVDSETYGSGVRYKLTLPRALGSSFRERLAGATAGRAAVVEDS